MMRTKRISGIAGAVALCAAGLTANTATARPVISQQAVLGVVITDGASDTFAIDASSDRTGKRPQGTVYGQEGALGSGGLYTLERIVCLAVEGNRATAGTQIVHTNIAGTPVGTFQQYHFVDNAGTGTPDLIGGGWRGATTPSCAIDHSNPPAGYAAIAGGDVAITGT